MKLPQLKRYFSAPNLPVNAPEKPVPQKNEAHPVFFDFSGKVVVVTGGSQGIGRRIAERFYEAGAFIAVCCPEQSDIDRCVEEISGGRKERIIGIAADVSKRSERNAFIMRVVDRFGLIDILINNAGVQFIQPSLEVSEEIWDTTVDTNLKGYFFAAQLAARDMIARDAAGVIVNIGSVNGVTVNNGMAVYAATKAAISQMTKSLGREWGKYNIRVNCVAPGSIPTPINERIYQNNPQMLRDIAARLPLSRRGTTDEIADAVLFLASDYASYITGQTLYVDGGMTLIHG